MKKINKTQEKGSNKPKEKKLNLLNGQKRQQTKEKKKAGLNFLNLGKKNEKRKNQKSGEKNGKLRWVFRGIQILFYIVILAGLGWSFKSYQNAKREIMQLSSLNGQTDLRNKQVEQLVAKAGKHVILPEEQPVVVNIENARAMAQEEPFYKDARDNDKVLVFAKEKKALIYRPDEDIIVNMGPVYVEGDGRAQEKRGPLEKITLEVRNGSEKPVSRPFHYDQQFRWFH